MIPRKYRLPLFILLVSVVFLSPCSLKYTPQTGEEFSREINRLRKLSQQSEGPSARAGSHLQMARLYAHHRNPQLDYGKSLQEYEAYSLLAPAEAKGDEVQNWVSILREVQRLGSETSGLRAKVETLTAGRTEKGLALERQVKINQESQAGMEKMQARLESLEKANRTLRESNEKMRETIERLKILDQQMEERRRSIR